MTIWIRWWGLGVFVMFAAILGGVWILFVDVWVKGLIERAGDGGGGSQGRTGWGRS